jgi:hypothetical protein
MRIKEVKCYNFKVDLHSSRVLKDRITNLPSRQLVMSSHQRPSSVRVQPARNSRLYTPKCIGRPGRRMTAVADIVEKGQEREMSSDGSIPKPLQNYSLRQVIKHGRLHHTAAALILLLGSLRLSILILHILVIVRFYRCRCSGRCQLSLCSLRFQPLRLSGFPVLLSILLLPPDVFSIFTLLLDGPGDLLLSSFTSFTSLLFALCGNLVFLAFGFFQFC